MASQMGYVGRIGNVIHYKMGGKFYSRAAPSKYKQTKATKAKASEFGKASSMGRIVRRNLDSVITNSTDRKMQNRLVREIFIWMQKARNRPAAKSNQPAFSGRFSFIEPGISLTSRWKVNLEVSNPSPGLVQIKIPAFIPNQAIVAPVNSVDVICKIAAVAIDVRTAKAIGKYVNEIVFHYDDKEVAAQTVLLKLPTPQGTLIVTGMSLEYSIDEYQPTMGNTYKALMPSEIIHAIYL